MSTGSGNKSRNMSKRENKTKDTKGKTQAKKCRTPWRGPLVRHPTDVVNRGVLLGAALLIVQVLVVIQILDLDLLWQYQRECFSGGSRKVQSYVLGYMRVRESSRHS